MNDQLVETMRRVKSDPAVVVKLYELLFEARYWALATYRDSEPNDPCFLNYDAGDGARELPIFTSVDRTLIDGFSDLPLPPESVEYAGPELWPLLLDVLANCPELQVAVDPGEAWGIRLSRSMILGMVNNYGPSAQDT